jgi:hypothetical protein
MVSRTRREEGRTGPYLYSSALPAPHWLLQDPPPAPAGGPWVPFLPQYRVPSSAPRPALPRTRTPLSLPSPGPRQPELCPPSSRWSPGEVCTILALRGLLEFSSVPATSRCPYEVTHLVGATRLVDEISQGTDIRSEPGSRSLQSLACFPGLGPSGRLPEAYPGYASLPRPQYLHLTVLDPVELLTARFTKYHSSLLSWSFPMSGPCP